MRSSTAVAVLDAPSAPRAGDGAARPVLHSQQYNSALQHALRRVDGIGAEQILTHAAAEVAYVRVAERLRALPAGASAATRLGAAAALHAECGFGALQLEGLSAAGGAARLPAPPAAPSASPVAAPGCTFTTGFLQGALAAVFGGWYTVRETGCAAGGAGECRFEAEPGGTPAEGWPPEAVWDAAPCPAEPADELEACVARALLQPPPGPDAAGRLQLGGATFTRVWADYYARVCYRFEQALPRVKGNKYTHTAAVMLTEAGHLCAHQALGGLLRSEQWARGVTPHLATPEDRLRAAVALVGLLGWGRWSVQALVPGERLIVRVEHSYEAAGYRRLFGEANRPKCYLAQGVAAGLMNLVYTRPRPAADTTDPASYNVVFRSPTSFRAREIACAAEGAPACEIVATRLSDALGTLL